MGVLDRLLGREKFNAEWSISDPAFAAWWFHQQGRDDELITQTTVWGLSAVQRAVSIIATTIAGLPLRTYERQGDNKVRMPSVFDDPFPGPDGLTPFAWTETLLTHLLLWRQAFLWHEARADGTPGIAYRPVWPGAFVVKVVNGKRQFHYTDPQTGEQQSVGSERITYIPGPSLDGYTGYPLLYAARAIFSAAISGDKMAGSNLRKGIRLGGIVTPAEGEEIDPDESAAILETLRKDIVGRENAGDIALINRRVKLDSWTPNNVDSQWIETRQAILGDIERLFGIPPHLMADIEKQTSWGTGVQEQNLSLHRYTLMGWSSRVEQVLSRTLEPDQFVEYEYKGLFQGTPAEEIDLIIKQKAAGLLTDDEARALINRPPLTPAQKAAAAIAKMPPAPTPVTDQEVAA